MLRKNVLIFLMVLTMICAFLPNSFAIEYTDLDTYLNPKPDRSISLDFKNASLNDVLKVFSQQSGLNFIASEDISSRTINLYLENVGVEDALKRILSAHNLTYDLEPNGNIFIVRQIRKADKDLMTRVYQLKHATVESSKIHSTLSSFSSSSSEESSSSEGSSSSSGGIASAIKAILTTNGVLVEDPRTNSLIVTDIPSHFPIIEQTIAKLDVRIPQILIEAEMLDVTKNTADLMGAKFGNTLFEFGGASKQTLFPFDEINAIDDSGGDSSTIFSDRYEVGQLSFSGLQFVLQFLRTQTDTRNLARPRILTLNNETAMIQVKTNEAIGLESTTTDTGSTSEQTQEAERTETGVFLTVTPQANVYTGEILMAIEPRVIQARAGKTFSGQTFFDPEERGTKSILRVKDGDTIIIGGLLRTDLSDTRTRIPVLSKVPLLGHAFKHKDITESERELIIFITPHILQEHLASNMRSKDYQPPEREQDMPKKRKNEIQKEISQFENRGR